MSGLSRAVLALALAPLVMATDCPGPHPLDCAPCEPLVTMRLTASGAPLRHVVVTATSSRGNTIGVTCNEAVAPVACALEATSGLGGPLDGTLHVVVTVDGYAPRTLDIAVPPDESGEPCACSYVPQLIALTF
ncbi:MAG: hypothetical protein K8W52_14535 [Deltaproteobacteria bacterium]|nr:hypothetical protein [Deltaproteobacteria bacterium]